jgi:putative hemolysin
MSIDDCADQLGLDLPEGGYVTLGGYLFDAFGHIPSEGETLDLGDWQLRVSEMDKRRIAKVVAKRTGDGTADPGGDGGGPRGTDRTPVG